MTKILYADAHRFPAAAADSALAREHGCQLVPVLGHEPGMFADAARDARGVLAWGGRYDDAVFAALPHLQVLARCGAGFDNIDLAAAAARGVVTTYVPGASDGEVAEHALGLIFDLGRRLSSSDRAVRDGHWQSAAELGPMIKIDGALLGLVGFGRIARALARRAIGLGMRVAAYDPFVDAPVMAESHVSYCPDLGTLLATSDFVSLHVPGLGGPQAPLIGAEQLATMRLGSFLVNTARGSLVDTDALVASLRAGHLAGAGLDVCVPEPLPPEHPLLRLTGVVITPHSAAFSETALSTLRRTALRDALAVVNGRTPRHPIPSKERT